MKGRKRWFDSGKMNVYVFIRIIYFIFAVIAVLMSKMEELAGVLWKGEAHPPLVWYFKHNHPGESPFCIDLIPISICRLNPCPEIRPLLQKGKCTNMLFKLCISQKTTYEIHFQHACKAL